MKTLDKIVVDFRNKVTCKHEHIDLPYDDTKDDKEQLVEACEAYKEQVEVEASVFSFNSISNTWMEMCVYYEYPKRFIKL